MRISPSGFLAALLLLATPLLPARAAAADHSPRFCEDLAILNRVSAKFQYQVTHVPHLPDVRIVDFHDIRQTRLIPYSEETPIARRYCGATALLSDGRKRPVWYLIEHGMGFVGLGDNVEFCVSGFDRWRVYNGRCRVLR